MADQSSSNTPDSSVIYMVTTVDNPYNPFTEWDEWYAFDASKGYHTPGLLDRIAITSDELSDADQTLAIQQAVREIAQEDVLGIYKLVSEDSYKAGDSRFVPVNLDEL